MSNWKDLKNNYRLMEIYQQRIEIIKLIREFFWSKNFKEVDTPIAVKYPGQEPYLSSISVLFNSPDYREEKLYLQTSPELAMKKLLGANLGNIFQICKCFRDYENWGGMHNTEFTMIEWYCSPGKLENIMDDTEELFKYVAQKINFKNKKKLDIYTKWDRISMKDLWKVYIGVNLDNYVCSVIPGKAGIQSYATEKLRVLCESLGFKVTRNDTYEDLFFQIFLNKIEPFLGKVKPMFVYDYPACMCSLSELCENDNRYAKRTELYIDGMELANAFGELIDADEQKKRLEEDRSKRQQLGKEIYDVDSDFINALKEIKQSTAGIALGVDRMVLLLTSANDLNEVIFQSVDDQIK